MSRPETVPFTPWTTWWRTHPHVVSLSAGAFAGMSAEAILYPLDSAKTRVQSRHGFWGSGGIRGIYRGIPVAICGSVPASAMFFTTYETVKTVGHIDDSAAPSPRYVATIMLASVLGELAAASIRVPVDVVKQRLQTGQKGSSPLRLQRSVLAASFQATAMRDVAQSSFQFPLYECLKLGASKWMSLDLNKLPTTTSAFCGSIAGMASAVVTTPFDLVKTRLNLRASEVTALAGRTAGFRASWSLMASEAREIYSTQGARGFFKGAGLRGAWMGLGGFIFLGSFEFAKNEIHGRHKIQDDMHKIQEDVRMQITQGTQGKAKQGPGYLAS